MSNNLLRLEEVASRLGISYTAVRELVLHSEAISYFRVGSRGVRVKEDDLEAYIVKIQVKEEIPSGSTDDRSGKPQDTRETYTGRGVLQGNPGRDKPFGVE